jgi:hypothetical protein
MHLYHAQETAGLKKLLWPLVFEGIIHRKIAARQMITRFGWGEDHITPMCHNEVRQLARDYFAVRRAGGARLHESTASFATTCNLSSHSTMMAGGPKRRIVPFDMPG